MTRKTLRKMAQTACAALLCLTVVALASCTAQTDDKQNAAEQGQEATSQTVEFVDDLGRTVELPANIERVAPSGFTAQQALLSICPDKMVGLASELNEEQLSVFGTQFANTPIFGAVLGSSDTLNREAIGNADPQVIIDFGEAKKNAAESLDELQEQLGIPCIFVEATLDSYGDAFRTLGKVLGMETRGEELGTYFDEAYATVETAMAEVDAKGERAKVAYIVGDDGINAIAKTSYQGQVVDMVADNVVVLDDASSKGTGNPIDAEQMALFDPEIILFQSQSLYEAAASDSVWSTFKAVQNNNYYLVPSMPYCWLNNPPTVNQTMGMVWLPRLLYPSAFDDTIEDAITKHFQVVYNYTLTDTELAEILTGATAK